MTPIQSSFKNKASYSAKEIKSVYQLKFEDIKTELSFNTNLKQEALYNFWKNSWEASFKSLGYKEKKQLLSNDFYSKRALTFFYEDTPIGCIFLECFNLETQSHLNTEYISNFPKEFISMLKRKKLTKAFALSNLTISPEWRKSKTDLHISQLLTSLGVWKACQENGDVLLSCTRNDRKINTVFKNHNARTYSTERRFNCDVDFIFINLENANIFYSEEVLKACLYFTSGHLFNHRGKSLRIS